MKYLLIACFAVAAFATLPVDVQGALKTFVDFKNTFNRRYTSAGEESHRFGCFHSNLKKINQLNAREDKATYGINKFADLCADEFKTMYHNLNIRKTNRTVAPVPTKAAPLDSYDWRDHGAVNSVKDQAQCGSCWAFSTVAALEGAWFVGGHGLNSFSEEELVQCATSAGAGCQGGDMIAAINWVIQNGGIDTESDYPYTSGTGVTGTCDNSKLANKVGKFATLLQAGSVESTYAQYLVAHGVLSIGVDAMDGWQTYTGGVKTACAGSSVDHGVAIVGYGVDGSTPYWTIRNSWGQSWGENGYIRVQRGVNCDLLTTEVSTAVSM